MFIELLVVGVILSFLYGSGFLQFGSGLAIAISIGVALAASAIGFVVTHYLARSVVDRMFGFASWNPRPKPEKKSALDPSALQRLQGLGEVELLKLVRTNNRDADLSRQVSEIFLQ